MKPKKYGKVIIITSLILICLLALTGCSSEITEGEVYQKEFKPEHTEVRVIPVCISNGKTVHTMVIPYTYHYPDRYIVYIKSFVDKEWKTADYYVTKEIYEIINIGDQFKYVKGRDLAEEPYTRERN